MADIDTSNANTFSADAIEAIYKGRFSAAARVELLVRDQESFETIFHAVRSATKSICLVFYIFRNDLTGARLAGILKQKSREGVQVNLLYDHFGSFQTPADFWDDMRSSGVRVRASRPFLWSSPGRYVHRDHRKLIIVDARLAFTGGLNIANEYSGFHLRVKGRGWRDTGILVEGPIVLELMGSFLKTWYALRGDPVEAPGVTAPVKVTFRGRLSGFGRRLIGKERPEALRVEQPPVQQGIPAMPIFVSSARGRRRMRRLLYYSINHAVKSIDLTTAYFIPSRRMLETLEYAVGRGVRVRLLLPRVGDVTAAAYAGRAKFGRLLEAGVEIYLYSGEILHAKTYTFDGCWSIVGSTNLDFQSLRYNDEGSVGILDEGFAVRMAELFEEDLLKAEKLEAAAWGMRPFSEKLKEHFFSLFRRRL